MNKLSKRKTAIDERVEQGKTYPISEAISLLKECATAKFSECVDIAIRLGVDARKSDQVVRGSTVLPHGTGKTIRVAVFAEGDNATKATAAGADIVGLADLAEQIKKGNMDFDVVIATPNAMRTVGQLGQILGPRGLMPNPKDGTVSADVTTAIKNAKAGQVRYRTDKGGIIHCSIGKVDFKDNALTENLEALVLALKKLKPVTAKGVYLKKLVISSTMGPGLMVDVASLDS